MLETRNAQSMVKWIIRETRKYATCRKESEFPILACMSNAGSRCRGKAARMVVARIEVRYTISISVYVCLL